MTAPELDPLPEGTLETLRKVSTSTIATQLYKRGFRQPQLLGVRPLSEVVDGFVGEAFTMRFIPMREDVDGLDPYRSGNTLQWEAFEAPAARAGAGGRLLPHRHRGLGWGHADDPGVEAWGGGGGDRRRAARRARAGAVAVPDLRRRR